MKKKFKVPLIIIVVLIILIILVIIAINILKDKEETNNVKVVDSIDNFSYTLDERDTKLMKDTYNELKKVLSDDAIDYESYAEYLASLFVIDLFTMSNKTNKYDVGSIEFVYPDSVDNFKTNVEDTIYKTMENNSNGKRKQALPTVKSVSIDETKNGEYILGEETYESFIVSINWSYESNLGYDDEATITLIKLNDKLYVVEYTTGE